MLETNDVAIDFNDMPCLGDATVISYLVESNLTTAQLDGGDQRLEDQASQRSQNRRIAGS